ncbi:MAG: restriction endonuclease subunit S [Betaproteobacteria bacterium]|nr:restriction endonuclease subunit S [Betaproteobacteria bacterium]
MPSDWVEATLDEMKSAAKGAFAMGPFGSRIKAENFLPHGIPVIKGGNLNGDFLNEERFDFLSEEKAAELSSSTARRLDLVITHRGTIGQVGIVPEHSKFERYIISQSQLKLTFDQDRVNPYFIYYFLRSPEGQRRLLMNASQVGVPAIAQALTSLRNLRIPFPRKAEQDDIAQTLRCLDDRIALLRETNATLEAIAQALFKSWFVDFDPVRAKAEGRCPEGVPPEVADLFPSEFEDSELGEIPKGWRSSTMDSISVVGIGKTPPRKEPQWFSADNSDVRWVSIRDMGVSGAFISQTSEYLTAESIERFNVRLVPDNIVLLSFKMTMGRVAITDGEMTTNEAIAHFKLDEISPLTSEYIYLHLKLYNYASLSSTSSIADAVNSKTVKAIPILVPHKKVVLAFQELIRPVFMKIKQSQQQMLSLVTLRDLLLPRLMSGKLTLTTTNQ